MRLADFGDAGSLALAACALVLVPGAHAQTPLHGVPIAADCATPFDNLAEEGELYAVQVGGANINDWLCDTRSKGGISFCQTLVSSSRWDVGTCWTNQEAPCGRDWVFITYRDGRVVADSVDACRTIGDFGLELVQRVGDSLPAGRLAGRGLVLPAGGSQFSIDLGVGSKSFPFGGTWGIEHAFAPLVEVNATDDGAPNCHWGGDVSYLGATGVATGQGLIRGYNVYRMPGSVGAPPTDAQLGTVANWVYFLDLRTIDLSAADTPGSGPPGNGADAPSDASADNDLLGWDNDDALPYTGDELVLFSDQALNPNGTARAGGTAGPVLGQGYWVAFQPVVDGNVAQFTNCPLGPDPATDHRLDLDGDTLRDAVDLDGVTSSPEFISPQAELGLPGLGLTHGGLPLLSTPVFGQRNPAAAQGGVELTARLRGRIVELTFTCGLEDPSLLGFNVYRLSGGVRTRVNAELVVARGGEGSVYRLTDTPCLPSRRLTRDALQYEVETLRADGAAPTLSGPFAAEDPASSPARRAR